MPKRRSIQLTIHLCLSSVLTEKIRHVAITCDLCTWVRNYRHAVTKKRALIGNQWFVLKTGAYCG
jgi:hypothetical protein